jgi:hypothetical protein
VFYIILFSCGQESIRKNFILVYELLDEMMDYGYPQGTSTETLKTFVYNEPVLVESAKPNIRYDYVGLFPQCVRFLEPYGAAAASSHAGAWDHRCTQDRHRRTMFSRGTCPTFPCPGVL